MKLLEICASSEALEINSQPWREPPRTAELTDVLGGFEVVDGDFVIIGGRRDSQFRYLDDLGIAILVKLPEERVTRVAIYFHLPSRQTRKKVSIYGQGGERATKVPFQGVLMLNGRELRSPLLFSSFPQRGDLNFVNTIAMGTVLSAMVVVESSFVRTISFDFL